MSGIFSPGYLIVEFILIQMLRNQFYDIVLTLGSRYRIYNKNDAPLAILLLKSGTKIRIKNEKYSV